MIMGKQRLEKRTRDAIRAMKGGKGQVPDQPGCTTNKSMTSTQQARTSGNPIPLYLKDARSCIEIPAASKSSGVGPTLNLALTLQVPLSRGLLDLLLEYRSLLLAEQAGDNSSRPPPQLERTTTEATEASGSVSDLQSYGGPAPLASSGPLVVKGVTGQHDQAGGSTGGYNLSSASSCSSSPATGGYVQQYPATYRGATVGAAATVSSASSAFEQQSTTTAGASKGSGYTQHPNAAYANHTTGTSKSSCSSSFGYGGAAGKHGGGASMHQEHSQHVGGGSHAGRQQGAGGYNISSSSVSSEYHRYSKGVPGSHHHHYADYYKGDNSGSVHHSKGTEHGYYQHHGRGSTPASNVEHYPYMKGGKKKQGVVIKGKPSSG
ncbi:unnamed protein product [Amoebophrya sp. A25]|nr:unnamed protein product [Amoebophrya sp. A25]|eukprot:GSA25T00002319001.1